MCSCCKYNSHTTEDYHTALTDNEPSFLHDTFHSALEDDFSRPNGILSSTLNTPTTSRPRFGNGSKFSRNSSFRPDLTLGVAVVRRRLDFDNSDFDDDTPKSFSRMPQESFRRMRSSFRGAPSEFSNRTYSLYRTRAPHLSRTNAPRMTRTTACGKCLRI